MEIVAVQFDIAWEDRAENHRRVARMLERARPAAGSLVVLPEMFASGFSMNAERIVEGPERPTEQFLCRLAREHKITVVGGSVQRHDATGAARNCAVVATHDSGVIARYAKLHLFPLCGENAVYGAGDDVVTAPWQGATIAPLICYDLRFPEAFRRCVTRGVHIFTVIANWPEARIEHWLALLRARAIENQAYVVGVNRIGRDPSLSYPGRSLIIDPRGEILADAGATEGCICAPVDIAALAAYRQEYPFLRNLRRDLQC